MHRKMTITNFISGNFPSNWQLFMQSSYDKYVYENKILVWDIEY